MLSSLLPVTIWSTCMMGFNSPSPLSKVRPWVLGSFLLLQVLGQVEVKPEPRGHRSTGVYIQPSPSTAVGP